MMQRLLELRKNYDEICEVRLEELNYPEEEKTLKTETFVALERDLLEMCYQEKIKLGINASCPGKNYGRRKLGSWQFKGRKKTLLKDAA